MLLSLNSWAYFDSKPAAKNAVEMNGIKFEDYADFTSKWKLVTLRYREDSKELRLIYANDKAWRGLKKLKPDYENGAMFAKVAFLTEDDPSFPSSKLPSSSVRYQFMKKDKNKYKDTDGWAYALFDRQGNLFSDQIKQATMACAACHRIVPERDFVFARPFQLDPKKPLFPEMVNTKKTAFMFSQKNKSEFAGIIKEYLDISDSKSEQKVSSLEGDLQKNGFSGTLNEVIPLLISEIKKTLSTSLLYLDKDNFTVVSMSKNQTDCTASAQQKRIHAVVVFNGKKVSDSEFCQ